MSTDPAQMRARSSAAAAERMRAHRKRRREGTFIVRVQLDQPDIDGFSGSSSCGLGSAKIPKRFRWPFGHSSIRCLTGCDRDLNLRLG